MSQGSLRSQGPDSSGDDRESPIRLRSVELQPEYGAARLPNYRARIHLADLPPIPDLSNAEQRDLFFRELTVSVVSFSKVSPQDLERLNRPADQSDPREVSLLRQVLTLRKKGATVTQSHHVRPSGVQAEYEKVGTPEAACAYFTHPSCAFILLHHPSLEGRGSESNVLGYGLLVTYSEVLKASQTWRFHHRLDEIHLHRGFQTCGGSTEGAVEPINRKFQEHSACRTVPFSEDDKEFFAREEQRHIENSLPLKDKNSKAREQFLQTCTAITEHIEPIPNETLALALGSWTSTEPSVVATLRGIRQIVDSGTRVWSEGEPIQGDRYLTQAEFRNRTNWSGAQILSFINEPHSKVVVLRGNLPKRENSGIEVRVLGFALIKTIKPELRPDSNHRGGAEVSYVSQLYLHNWCEELFPPGEACRLLLVEANKYCSRPGENVWVPPPDFMTPDEVASVASWEVEGRLLLALAESSRTTIIRFDLLPKISELELATPDADELPHIPMLRRLVALTRSTMGAMNAAFQAISTDSVEHIIDLASRTGSHTVLLQGIIKANNDIPEIVMPSLMGYGIVIKGLANFPDAEKFRHLRPYFPDACRFIRFFVSEAGRAYMPHGQAADAIVEEVKGVVGDTRCVAMALTELRSVNGAAPSEEGKKFWLRAFDTLKRQGFEIDDGPICLVF